MEDFENALKFATKSVSKELLKRYDKWNEQQAA
jgi:SpoVK/Ycf46/Vps4 family AAA+-type ATPase